MSIKDLEPKVVWNNFYQLTQIPRPSKGADVDGHVEQAEGAVPLGGILRVVVQIAHQHLQIAFEQARADGNHEEGAQHEHDAHGIGSCGDGEGQVTGEHDADAGDHALSVADLIGQDTAHYGHEIHQSQENGIYLAGYCLIPAEFGLQEQHEDGQHGVIAEAFTGIGQSKGEKSFGLSFEHISGFRISVLTKLRIFSDSAKYTCKLVNSPFFV